MARVEQQHARFEALVLPHLGRLFAFARCRLPVRADAEDAVQDACLRAWAGFAGLRDDTRVLPWLYRILRGVLDDERTRHARRARLTGAAPPDDAPTDAAGDPDALFEEVAARVRAEQLGCALRALPADFAAALELHAVAGLRYREIADVLGIPVGTVTSRIARGRRLLVEALAERAPAVPVVRPKPATRERDPGRAHLPVRTAPAEARRPDA